MVSDILGHLPPVTKIDATIFYCGDAGINQETDVQPDIDISIKVVTCKYKSQMTVNKSSKKRNEYTDKNNTNINAEVATTAESTNIAVDINAEQTNSNSTAGKDIPWPVDCKGDDNQCHCGSRLKSSDDYDKHVNRSRENNLWVCSRCINLLMAQSKSANQSSLWSHYRCQHESRYQNYCDIKGY